MCCPLSNHQRQHHNQYPKTRLSVPSPLSPDADIIRAGKASPEYLSDLSPVVRSGLSIAVAGNIRALHRRKDAGSPA